jgi:glycosyltransferase involved in cell wall biosynthesis
MLEYFDTNITFWGLLLVISFSFCVFMLLRFYVKYYRAVSKYKNPLPSDVKHPVSVVVSCKNELEYVKQHLPFWLEQKYGNFEVVAVCDESDEEILYILRSFEQRYRNLKIVKISSGINFFDEEKFALSIGAKEASFEHLIFTTIESRPATEYCIDYVQSAFTDKTSVVIGYSSFVKENANIFSRFFYIDNTVHILAMSIKGFPVMGQHRLLGYKKDYFLKTGGYTGTYSIKTGVYDYLHSETKSDEIAVQIDPHSVVKVAESLSHNVWQKEEKNYFTAFSCTHGKSRKEEILYRISLLSSYIIALFFLTFTEYKWNTFLLLVFLVLVFVKYATQMISAAMALKVLSEKSIWIFIPLFELLYLPNVIISLFRISRHRQ